MKKEKKMSIAFRVQYYIDCVYKYQKEFGLFNWEIKVEEIDDDDCRGEIQYDIDSRLAVVYYDTTWINDVNLEKDEIKLVAFHEICELFLSEIHMFIVKHGNENLSDSMTHNVIRFMENKLLKEIK